VPILVECCIVEAILPVACPCQSSLHQHSRRTSMYLRNRKPNRSDAPPPRDTFGDQLNASHLPHSQTLSSAERISLAVRGSPIGSLWLQTLAEPSERGSIPAGIDRNLTPDNLRIALKLLPLLLRPALGAVGGTRRHALIGFFVRKLLVGLVPAAALVHSFAHQTPSSRVGSGCRHN